ncbi:WD domain-containing [Pyrenophora seminiperda CCB06]|uniref:WD domain-containing n=1 Tax=Pyrenophora seminiperda CCB06 TaxID=1302712 RepID=A0A3M7M104_9PLEO|nr:WD domain-containing [Pyrenophora seminiperda CCB06]
MNTNASQPTHRPNPLTYPTAMKKGTRFLDLTCANNPSPPSPFSDPSLASTWGYTTEVLPFASLHTNSSILDLILGTSTSASAVQITTMHSKHATVKGRAGVLIAEANTSPANMLDPFRFSAQEVKEFRLPELKQWSDVAFLQWKSLCIISNTKTTTTTTTKKTSTLPSLNAIIRHTIINPDTKHICNTIVDRWSCPKRRRSKRQAKFWRPTWPGLVFHTEEEETRALCGTPNGKGVLWLLAQHAEELRRKTVGRVTLFWPREEEEALEWKRECPSLVFWLEDVEENIEEDATC